MISLIKQNILLFLVVVFGVVGGVWYSLTDRAPEALLPTESPEGTSDKELVATLLALRAVKLDGTIFVNPAFVALQDFGTQIAPEPVGRQNPFAPLSGTEVTVTTSTPPTGARQAPFAPR